MSTRIAAIFVLALVAAAAPGQDSSLPKAKATGYLAGGHKIDATAFLPAPPAPGSKAFDADRDAFESTRALKNGERWQLAASDDRLDTDSLMADYSCAAGFTLNRITAPKLAALFEKVRSDAGSAIGTGKTFFKRPRPLIGNDAPICVDRSAYENSYSYPSGHSTLSWTFTLILAELAPDRAGEIAARGRAFGESRVVCGVHWASDVEAGRLAAATVFAALQGNAAFRRDMEGARAEIAKLRKKTLKPDAASCALPNAAAAKRPW
jgi:acid phosphatase (class A)